MARSFEAASAALDEIVTLNREGSVASGKAGDAMPAAAADSLRQQADGLVRMVAVFCLGGHAPAAPARARPAVARPARPLPAPAEPKAAPRPVPMAASATDGAGAQWESF